MGKVHSNRRVRTRIPKSFILFFEKEWENSQSMLSKDLVIKVLQEVRYEACPVFLMVAAYDGSRDIAQDMKNELIDRGNPNQSLMPSMLNTRMMSTDLL